MRLITSLLFVIRCQRICEDERQGLQDISQLRVYAEDRLKTMLRGAHQHFLNYYLVLFLVVAPPRPLANLAPLLRCCSSPHPPACDGHVSRAYSCSGHITQFHRFICIPSEPDVSLL
jgi:hypothetical protein